MNVIVVIADSLRVDHVGCYGNDWIRTPHLDAFAAESTQFMHAYSEGLPTLPTRTAFWTGRFTFPFRGWQHFEHDDVLLAEVLWDQGYTSALITDVYHMHKPGMNCARGFDYARFIRGQEYDPWIVDPSIEVDISKTSKLSGTDDDDLFRRRWAQYLRNVSWWEGEEDHFVAQVVKAGMRWLGEHQGEDQLFLWLDCFDPHEPWDPPPPYDRMYNPDYDGIDIIDPVPGEVAGYLTDEELNNIKSLYAGEVTLVDKWVGRFLEAAREMGFLDNSLVVFATDHGEPFGEHGIIRKCRPWLHEELVHIPMLIRLPDGTGHGKQVSALVETCDLMPTILGFLEADAPDGMTGESLLPLIRGEAQNIRDYAYSGYFNRQWSIRTHEWSYLLPLYEATPELYDRTDDPTEQDNLVGERPELAAELELELRRFVDGLRRGS